MPALPAECRAVHGDGMSPSSVTVHAPAHAVLAAPLMLGYWPEDSLCAVFTDAHRRVTLVLRWDTGGEADLPPVPPTDAGGASHRAVHLIAYTSARGTQQAPAPLDRASWGHARALLGTGGIPLTWTLAAQAHGEGVRWCHVPEPACGDAAERGPSVQRLSRSEVAGQAARWGLPSWCPTRRAYVADIEPDPAARAQVALFLRDQVPVLEDSRDAAIAAARDLLVRGEASAADMAAALVAVRDVQVRDTLLWDLMRGDPAAWPGLADGLARVVAAAPDSHVAAPATILAILRWQTGDGTRASAAIARARAADPAYTLALLVEGCLATGMHPAMWLAGLAGLSREECRRAA